MTLSTINSSLKTMDCHIIPNAKVIIDLIRIYPDYNLPPILRDPERWEIQFSVVMKSGMKGLIRSIPFSDGDEAIRHFNILLETM